MPLCAAALAMLAVWLAVPPRRLGPTGSAWRRLSGSDPGDRAPARPGVGRRLDGGREGNAGPAAGVGVGFRVSLASAAGLAVLLLVPGAPGVVGAAVAAAVMWRRSTRLETAAVRRHRALLEAELPHVVDLLLAAVAAGSAPEQALARVVDVGHPAVRAELSVPLSRLRLGADVTTVWQDLADHPQLGRIGVTLARSSESGAPIVDALDRLSTDLRDDQRSQVQARVRQVEVKAAVPLGLCLLPSFVLLGVVPLVAGSAVGLLGLPTP